MKKIIILFLVIILLHFNTVCFAEPESDININLVKIPLKSKLTNEYKAYQYTIENNGDDVELINARIINGNDGSIAYTTLDKGHPIAKMWLVCGITGLFTLGLGWAVGIVATPFVWTGSSVSNHRAKKESNSYPNLMNVGYFKKGDVITVKTLVPVAQQPELKLKFKDKTGELYTISR